MNDEIPVTIPDNPEAAWKRAATLLAAHAEAAGPYFEYDADDILALAMFLDRRP